MTRDTVRSPWAPRFARHVDVEEGLEIKWGMPTTLLASAPRYVFYGNYSIVMQINLAAAQGLCPDFA